MRFPPKSSPNSLPLFASEIKPRGIARSTGDFAEDGRLQRVAERGSRGHPCGTTSRTCRDRADAPSVLEAFRFAPSSDPKTRTGKYALWKDDPYHTSLRFEERRNGICVVRIGEHYRAVAVREGGVIAWFWIGTHAEYNRFSF